MNFKTTYYLFGALLVFLGLFGLTQFLKQRPGDDNEYVLASFHDRKDKQQTSDIDRVEIKRKRPKEETIVFVKGDNGWQIKEPFQTPVHADDSSVEDVIRQATQARRELQSDAQITDLNQLGLETPAAVVTLKKGGDREWTLNLGDESPDKKVVYLTSSESKEPAVVRRSDLDSLYKNIPEFRSKELLAVSPFNSSHVDLAYVDPKDAKKTYALDVDKTDSTWTIRKPFTGEADYEGEGEGEQAKGRIGVKGLLQAIAGVRVESDADFFKDDVKNLAAT